MELHNKILSDIINYMKYAKWKPDKFRKETFEEVCDRNKEMHLNKLIEMGYDEDTAEHAEVEEVYEA